MNLQDMKKIIHLISMKNSYLNVNGTMDMLNRLKYSHTTTRMITEPETVQRAYDDVTLKVDEFMALSEKRRDASISTVIDSAANNNLDLLSGIFGFSQQENGEFKQIRELIY